MNSVYDPKSVSALTRSHIFDVAAKIRALSDEMLDFAGRTDSSYLKTISVDISKIGWSALFAARTIEEIQQKVYRRSEVPLETQLQQIATQLDALHTATRYMEISLEDLIAWRGDLPESDQQKVSTMLIELGNRLVEVGNGCK
jgi:hypothetical protein